MQRLNQVGGHMQPSLVAAEGSATSQVGVKKDTDAVIVCALRTALARSKKGSFKDTPAEDLLAACLELLYEYDELEREHLLYVAKHFT